MDSLSISSCSLQTELSFRSEESPPAKKAAKSQKASTTDDVAETGAIMPCVLLLAVALQLPNVLNEIMQILDLHYHSVPILVLLGVFPGVFFKKNSKVDGALPRGESSLHSNLSDIPVLPSSQTLLDIQDFYQKAYPQDEVSQPAVVVESLSEKGTVDEWGHFADFDEEFIDTLASQAILITQPASRMTLTPLAECEEEE